MVPSIPSKSLKILNLFNQILLPILSNTKLDEALTDIETSKKFVKLKVFETKCGNEKSHLGRLFKRFFSRRWKLCVFVFLAKKKLLVEKFCYYEKQLLTNPKT